MNDSRFCHKAYAFSKLKNEAFVATSPEKRLL